ncbi:MAG: hypothetical protein JXB62_02365 [Pirellulales bacterium]|nr:hypothetical protein [Pirellulales bacterium]
MFAYLFAMSWVGVCVILVGIYLVYAVIRGIVDFIRWFVEDYLDDLRARKAFPDRRRDSEQS